MDEAEWDRGIARNLRIPFAVTRAALPAILASGGHGRIVFVSSVTGPVVSNPGSAVYGAAKAGIMGLVRGARDRGRPVRGHGQRGPAGLDRDRLAAAGGGDRRREHPDRAVRDARRGRRGHRVPRLGRGELRDRPGHRRRRRQHDPGVQGPLGGVVLMAAAAATPSRADHRRRERDRPGHRPPPRRRRLRARPGRHRRAGPRAGGRGARRPDVAHAVPTDVRSFDACAAGRLGRRGPARPARRPRQLRRRLGRGPDRHDDRGRLGPGRRREPQGHVRDVPAARSRRSRRRGGCIVNVSSDAGLWGNKGAAIYSREQGRRDGPVEGARGRARGARDPGQRGLPGRRRLADDPLPGGDVRRRRSRGLPREAARGVSPAAAALHPPRRGRGADRLPLLRIGRRRSPAPRSRSTSG